MDLYKIMSTLIELKFQRDPDGDLPVSGNFWNRNVESAIRYVAVPYYGFDSCGKNYDTPEHFERAMRAVMLNHDLAEEQLSQIMRSVGYRYRELLALVKKNAAAAPAPMIRSADGRAAKR